MPKIIGSGPSGRFSPDTISPEVTEPPDIIDQRDASLSGFLANSAATTGIIIPETMNEYEWSISSGTSGIFMASKNPSQALPQSIMVVLFRLFLVEAGSDHGRCICRDIFPIKWLSSERSEIRTNLLSHNFFLYGEPYLGHVKSGYHYNNTREFLGCYYLTNGVICKHSR